MKYLMTGNEGVARGLYEAGAIYCSAYPGTPSTEILEEVAQYKDVLVAEWANNEKVALESAIGASLAGVRSMAAMKHVGVNVAADPLFTIAYTGTTGGLILVSADDPGCHSSQNEQDNRYYAKFAKIPMLEPANSQEAKDYIAEAYRISEQFHTAVLFRMTTRVCHSKSLVELGERVEVAPVEYVKNAKKYVAAPANARTNHPLVEERTRALQAFNETYELNREEWNDSKIGIITASVAYNYAKEVFGETANYLKLGLTWPLPMEKIKAFAERVETLYVIEELEPFIEEELKIHGIDCIGKERIPRCGELNPDIIAKALLDKDVEFQATPPELTVGRPPILCAGCPHRGIFYEMSKMKRLIVTGDIGCYTLGSAEPLNTIDSVICMGASISMGHGANKAFEKIGTDKQVVTVIGDSTFFHTGVNSLLNSVYNKSNNVNIIMDNRITGMTGHQDNPGTGYTLMGEETKEIDFEQLVKALGIEKVKTINPLNLEESRETLKEFLEYKDGPSVIITRWPCALKRYSKQDLKEFKLEREICQVHEDLCRGCRNCIRTGCPSISFDKETKKASINPNMCVGCTVCLQSCPFDAIKKVGA
ncbi:MAG TPA: indolepyruvate ferredoxin oxidoreductase subunit alpha [Tissierellia bacterium]|nr:indolepyruvate ferredoxin oxidoreductase subunit alpha [Tissierellia bacterium]